MNIHSWVKTGMHPYATEWTIDLGSGQTINTFIYHEFWYSYSRQSEIGSRVCILREADLPVIPGSVCPPAELEPLVAAWYQREGGYAGITIQEYLDKALGI